MSLSASNKHECLQLSVQMLVSDVSIKISHF